MFGGEHYGIVSIADYNGKQREIVYKIQYRMDAVGIEGGYLKLFVEGKYQPWLLTFDVKLENETFYNQHSKSDKSFVEDYYGLKEQPLGCFTLQKKN